MVSERARADWRRQKEILRDFEIEDVEDHGLMRLREGRGWTEGFVAIADRGLVWTETTGSGDRMMPTKTWVGVPYDLIVGHKGLRKIATADLFLTLDTGEVLRFNGSKIFVYLCCRALAAPGGSRAWPRPIAEDRLLTLTRSGPTGWRPGRRVPDGA